MKIFELNFINKYLLGFIMILIINISMLAQGDPNVLIGLNAPAYGVKIKANFPGYNGGWARGFHVVNQNNTESHIQFGAVGSASNGITSLSYGYIGKVYNDTYLSFRPSGRKVGIGTNSPAEKLHINGSVRGHVSGALRISTGHGYVDVGPKNTGWTHFVTDRSKFYFNKEIRVNSGFIGSYDENLSFRTQGTTRMTILKDNGNVGIGNNNPGGKLTVNSSDGQRGLESLNPNGNSHFPWSNGWSYISGKGVIFRSNGNTERMRILSNGNIGIGNTSPDTKLEVKGIVRATSTTSRSNATQIGHTGNNGFINTYGAGHLDFSRNMVPLMRLSSNGVLNIGNVSTPSDDYKLYVEKGIMSEKVRVAVKNSDDWADYVFEKEYELMPLKDVGNFIYENKHLPGVPTAKHVVKYGIDLAKTDAVLLKKLEEAYLYILDLQQQMDSMNKELSNLKIIRHEK